MADIVQKFGIDANEALKALERLDQGFAKLESRLTSVADRLQNYNRSVKDANKANLGKAFDSTTKQAEKLNQSLDKLTVSTGLIARILTTQLVVSIFGKFRRELVESAQEAAEFQRQVALIQTIAGGAGFETIAREVRLLSDNFNIPLLQAAKGTYNALSNQVGNFEESLQFASEAAKFAKATNSSLADSVDLLSGAMQSFNLTAADTSRISSVFFTAIDKGRITADQLANSVGRVAPAAHAAGLSLEETAAAAASISVKGSSTAESLTQLRGLISGLIKPTPALRKELEALGFSESSTAIKTLGFARTLDALHRSTAGSQQELAKLFPNVRAISGELALSGDEFQTLIDNIKEMGTGGREFAATKAAIVLGTEAERVGKELNKLKNELTLGLGNAALEAADGLFKLTGGADNLIKQAKVFGPVAAGIAANLALVKSEALLAGTALSGAGAALAKFAIPVGLGIGLAKLIDEFALTPEIIDQLVDLRQHEKAFLEDFLKFQGERRDAARQADSERIGSAQNALTALNRIFISETSATRAANDALVDSTKSALDKIVGARQRLVDELGRAAADSERTVTESFKRVQNLEDKQSDRDFEGRISGASDVQKFGALTKRAEDFAREASRLLSSAISPEEIQRALSLFGRAESAGDQAAAIADRTKNRALEANAAAKLRRISDDQIRAEQALQNLQKGRLPRLQKEEDRQKSILNQIKEQANILIENTGAFDDQGRQFSEADLAKRAATRQSAAKQLAALGLSQKDLSATAALGLADFVQKAGQQLSRDPLKLAFDVEAGSREIEQRLQASFSNFKLSIPFDIGDLGKLESPDAIIAGLDKIGEKADELRAKMGAALAGDTQKSLLKQRVDETIESLDAPSDKLRFLLPKDLVSTLQQQFSTIKSTAKSIADSPVITEKQVGLLRSMKEEFINTAQSFGDGLPGILATRETEKALDALIVQLDQLADSKDSIDVSKLQSQLQPLEQLISNLDLGPKFTAASNEVATNLTPKTKLAVMEADKLASAAGTTAAAYQAAAAAVQQINGSSAKSVNKSLGGRIDYRAAGGSPRGTDTIPAMLSPGETVIDAKNSRQFFSQIQAIRAGKPPVFRQDGGSVVNNNIGDIHVAGGDSPKATAREVMQSIRRELRRGSASL